MKKLTIKALVLAQILCATATCGLAYAENSNSAPLVATPIPPVVTGTIDLEEIRATNVIDLPMSGSRSFKLSNKVVRTSISDPGVAEPVLVSENQLVLLGKAPGVVTLVIWDDAGNVAAFTLNVNRHQTVRSGVSLPPNSKSEEPSNSPATDTPVASSSPTDSPATNSANTASSQRPRNRVKVISAGGGIILMGDVDTPEALVRTYSGGNATNDDRGMNIQAANNRLTNTKPGEAQTGTSK